MAKRKRQSGRAIERVLGDRGQILYPDGGAKPLKVFVPKKGVRLNGTHGSHLNGRHKQG